MRVTLACAYDPFPTPYTTQLGGVERVYSAFARGLARRGHDVTVLCAGQEDAPGVDGIDVIRVRPRGTVMRAPVVDLRPHLPDSDIVHVAGTYPFVTPRMLRRARQKGLPAVLDFHFEPDPARQLGRWAATVYRTLGAKAYSLADRVLVRSFDYANHAPSLRQVPTHIQRALSNGFDPSMFTPTGPRDDGPYILFVGRLVPYKGLDVLLEALTRTDGLPPLWIAGDGPERARLEEQARRLHVDVRFLGRVPDDRLPSLYRGAALTVLPSVGRQECFGMTLLESMACGTPVLASDIPGVRAVAARGGRIAPAGDPMAWARALHDAFAEPMPRGARLARRVADDCAWPAVIERLESVYAEVAA